MSSLLRRQTIRSFVKANVEQIPAGWDAAGKMTYRWPLLAPTGAGLRRDPAPRRKKRERPKARWNGKRFMRQATTKRPTFKVPAQPVHSTRADRADAHKAKMLRKGR